MQPFSLASVACAVVVLIAWSVLWLQRSRSADRRRATCISAILVCLLILAGSLTPDAWRPDVPSVSYLPQPVARVAHPLYSALYPQPSSEPAPAPTLSPVPQPEPQRTMAISPGLVVSAGAILVGAWWLLGLAGAFRFLRRSSEAPSEIRAMSRYRVRIAKSLGVPACLGGPRPTVLLPERLLTQDPWELEAIIRHEEAHIAAGDHVWLALGYVLCALQWFNPLCWLLLRRFKFEAELAADDAVLLSGCRPSGYAGLLAHFGESKGPAMLAPMLTGPGSMAKRLHAILSTTNRRTLMNHRQRIWSVAVAAVAGTALATVIAARPAGQVLTWTPQGAPDVPAIKNLMPKSESRRVELVQVGMKDDAKGIVEWDANGNAIPAGQAIEHSWRPNDTDAGGAVSRYRHIVFRVEAAPGDTDPESCVGSSHVQSPSEVGVATEFASSDFLITKGGWHYFVDHLSVLPVGTFHGEVDKDGHTHVVEVSKPVVKDFGWKHFEPTNVGVSVTLDAPTEIGSVFKDFSPGKVKMKPGTQFPKGFTKPASWKNWTEVTFDMPIVTAGYVSYRPVTSEGQVLPEDRILGSFGGGYTAGDKTMRMKYLVGLPQSDIGDLKVYFRPSISGDLLDIPLSPKEDIKP